MDYQAKDKNTRDLTESRQLRKDYLSFIKSSQQFYRELIRALAMTHGGIPELERVAKRLYRDCPWTHNGTRQPIH